MFVCLFVCLFVGSFVCLFVRWFVCLFVWLSLSDCLYLFDVILNAPHDAGVIAIAALRAQCRKCSAVARAIARLSARRTSNARPLWGYLCVGHLP